MGCQPWAVINYPSAIRPAWDEMLYEPGAGSAIVKSVERLRKRITRPTQATPAPIDTTLQIIRLRHRHHTTMPSGSVQPQPRDWQYQWMVRGHWRKQPYPSKGPDVYKHIFIKPYAKGPESKPMKGTEKIYAVVQ